MIYVMSDLHGCYHKFLNMLEQISFSTTDEIYLIGDICDRGEKSAQIYWDIMKRENVHCIMGNHEKMLLEALPHSFGFLKNKFTFSSELDFDLWSACGGSATCASFIEAGIEKVYDIYQYILSFPYYQIIDCDECKYLLVHAGLDSYTHSKPLGDYLPEELVWHGFDHNGTYYPLLFDKIIVGHTPTFILQYNNPPTIFRGKGNVIDVDCGAVFEESNGRLACLCLDTMEEFYV